MARSAKISASTINSLRLGVSGSVFSKRTDRHHSLIESPASEAQNSSRAYSVSVTLVPTDFVRMAAFISLSPGIKSPLQFAHRVTAAKPPLRASFRCLSKVLKMNWFADANQKFLCSTLLGVTCQKSSRCRRHRTAWPSSKHPSPQGHELTCGRHERTAQ